MADLETEPTHNNGYATSNDDDDERGKMRPADIDAVSNSTNIIIIFIYLLFIALVLFIIGRKRNGTQKKSRNDYEFSFVSRRIRTNI